MFERLKRLFQRRAPDPSELAISPPRTVEQHEPPRSPTPAGSDAKPANGSPANNDSIQVSLRSVVLKLPETLKGKIKQPPAGGVRISIPASKILPQLPQGSVRISFGELRKASPPGIFSDAPDRDHTLVDLPLQEILQQLKPDQLPRRLRQKRVEVPDEVIPIFTSQRGQSSVRIAKPSAPEPSRARPGAPPVAPPVRSTPGSGPAPITPSIPLPMPSALRMPSAPPPPIKPSTPLPSLGTPTAPAAAPRPAFIAPSSKPLQPHTTPAPLKPSAPPAAPAPAPISTTTGATDYISVPLATVTSGWPEPIRHALAGLNAPDATLQLPAAETEQALRRGKVVFPWKRLKPLVRPPLKTALAPALDDLQIELPLPAIAPLFMAQRKSTSVQRKYDVGSDIPDVFSGRGLAAAHAPAQAPAAPPKPASPPSPPPKPPAPPAPTLAATAPPTTPAPVPAPAPAPAPVPALKPSPPTAPPAAATPDPAATDLRDIGDVFGQPGRKNWAPAEIAQRTAALKGVAGAVITMQDGLLIAAQLPPGLNGETIAAFLPQMFSRMMQYSKELKFGEADNITFIIDHVPLQIYRTGGVYFAALGRAHEPLPELPLRLIASHLGPQSK
jgi:predicted regulator of Ras-like GTPase activity (Roadblock/LC7/MglB family)